MKTTISLSGPQATGRILRLPLVSWVLLGFLSTFTLFLVIPVFLDPSLTMQFKAAIPTITPIAFDFRGILALSSQWLHTGVPPLIIYPTFTLLFFSLFNFFTWEMGYQIFLVLIFLCFIATTLILPAWMNQAEAFSALGVLLLITGLLSYGLQFEMERGQWNLIAFTFCLMGVYLFHHHRKLRPLAYLLFSVSIQLKLFPAIFVFTLIEDFRDWRSNIRRFLALGLANILALFILGIDPVLNSIRFLTAPDVNKQGIGVPHNHSITSFTLLVTSPDSLHPLLHNKLVEGWLASHSWILQLILFGVFVVCFAALLWQEHRRNEHGFSPYVFLACTIGACIIPSISFDYKLCILPPALALLIPNIAEAQKSGDRLRVVLLMLLMSVAYSSTLYSFANKPAIVRNNFPALFILLLTCLAFSWMRSTRQENGGLEPSTLEPGSS